MGARVSLAACLLAGISCGGTGTDLNTLVNQGDDGGVAGQGGGSSPTQYQDPFSGAPPYSAKGGGGGDTAHNAGKSCMNQGCHPTSGGGGEAPAFLIGGTVYKDYLGTTPAVGVEVRIVDSSGNAASAYSDSGGSFYIRAGSSTTVTFPAIVGARDGTTTRPMITTLTSSMGSCAQQPCHTKGGSPAMGTYYPIHVP